MHIIEPCCAQKQLHSLRNAIGKNGSAEFKGYGDLSITELLPAVLARYDNVKMLITAPSVPDQAAEIIAKWMRVQWARMDGRGKVFSIRHLTIVADLSRRKSPVASGWLKDNPFGDRLTLVDREQEDTVILLPDFAVTGPVNMRYGHEFTATATTKAEDVADLWKKYGSVPAGKAPEKPEEKPETSKEKPAAKAVDFTDATAGEPVKVEPPKPKKEMPGLEAGQQESADADDQTMS